jgi:FkbM family methyltransferase
MLVEECCQALLAEILPQSSSVDSSYAIEIGCGTFAFYCELFDRLGLKAIAVEPLPVENLRKLCRYRNISLAETCVAEHDGLIDLYVGNYLGNENLNLNSTRPDWWGAASTAKKVHSMTLRSLIEKFNIEEISCLKIDIEGAEYSVLSQFSDLSLNLLPRVLMFEYGGGGTFENQQGGWTEDFLKDTLSIVNLLRDLGYEQAIQIDSEEGSCEKILDLKTSPLDANNLFSPKNVYGNIIALYASSYAENKIRDICRSYRDNQFKTLPLEITEPLLKRISIKIRQLMYR